MSHDKCPQKKIKFAPALRNSDEKLSIMHDILQKEIISLFAQVIIYTKIIKYTFSKHGGAQSSFLESIIRKSNSGSKFLCF